MDKKYQLSDLLDMAHLQKMADSHYSATGIPIGIIDAFDSTVLVGAGWQDICVHFHRVHPETLEKCRDSDAFIKNRLHRGEACQYKCQNGLWDIGIPIVVGNRHLATLFLGQFYYEHEARDRDFFSRQAEAYGFDPDAYLAALDRVPVFSKEKVATILEYDKALVAFIEDLAEQALARMAADEKIKDHVSFLQTLLDTIPSPIFYKDLEGKYLGANRAWCEKIIGLPVDKIINKSLNEFPDQIPEDLGALYRASDAALVEKGGTQVYEGRVKCADGDFRNFIFTKGLFPDASGKPAGLVGVMADVTEQRRMEEEKEQLQNQLMQLQKIEAIGALAGGIAHDFNNILYPLIGYSELLLDELPPESPHRESLEEILGAGMRARELVKQILTFSRQEKKDVHPVELQKIITEVLKLVRASLPATITIEREIDGNCSKILADETHIHQVTMNVITNAYHAMETGTGTVKIVLKNVDAADLSGNFSSLHVNRYVLLSISDNGVGMDENTMKKVFDPYFTTKDKERGTGLGLSVVYGIVKGYGGEIRIDSRPGKGTVVDIYFPALMTEYGRRNHLTAESTPGGNEHILLVDDEAVIIQMARKVIARFGYRVTAMTSSADALAAVKADPDSFDLLVSDMTMPGMTGIELLREIRKIRPDMQAIICTGFSDQMNNKTGRSLGIQRILMKPASSQELAGAIRGVLDAAPND